MYMYQKGCKTLSLFHFRIYFSASSTTTLAKENAVASNLKEEIYWCCSLAYTCLYIFWSKTFFFKNFSPLRRPEIMCLSFFLRLGLICTSRKRPAICKYTQLQYLNEKYSIKKKMFKQVCYLHAHHLHGLHLGYGMALSTILATASEALT